MLKIGQSHYYALRQHGEETYPHECCGVLLGHIDENDIRIVTSIARAGNTLSGYATAEIACAVAEGQRVYYELLQAKGLL